MPTQRLHYASGQVLIISLLVLGFLTLGFVLIGSSSIGESAKANVVLEQKVTSAAAATGCVEQALNRLGGNALYGGNETLTVASSTCRVQPIVNQSGIYTLGAMATSSNQVTRYRVTLTSRAPITISSWSEVAGF